MSKEVWSYAANDVVEFDEEGSYLCAECGDEIDSPRWEDDEPLCADCYEDLFGTD